jgi:hypothetical protein
MEKRKNNLRILVTQLLIVASGTLLLLFCSVTAAGQRGTQPVKLNATPTQTQPAIYREYRGVSLGMKATEVRAKLGEPVLKSDEQDYFVMSSNETAQIVYTTDQRVRIISTDYTNGVGAPDVKTVVGGDPTVRPDGSLFKMVQYDAQGVWVSYNKSAGLLPVVTITIQVFK